MAKFYGKVGFGETVKTAPGVTKARITELNYYGDIRKKSLRYQNTQEVNDDVTLSMIVSIVADPYAIENFHLIRYVVLNGVRWKVESVEPSFPRISLTLGGVYNGEPARATS